MDAVTYVVDPALDEQLEAALVALWVAVTNAGGAVGFVPPVTTGDVAPHVAPLFARLRSGPDRLVVAVQDQVPVGMATLELRPGELFAHWAWVKRVQVHPDLQGRGVGSRLTLALHDVAREAGLEQLFITVRGGTGVERVYERLGYRKVATLPRVIRLSADDYRDEHHLLYDLTPHPSGAPGPSLE
ncbi:MAG TPA: GNAT family N-acetyltransferase [Nitriliruptorales bacterium]